MRRTRALYRGLSVSKETTVETIQARTYKCDVEIDNCAWTPSNMSSKPQVFMHTEALPVKPKRVTLSQTILGTQAILEIGHVWATLASKVLGT